MISVHLMIFNICPDNAWTSEIFLDGVRSSEIMKVEIHNGLLYRKINEK